MTEHRAAMLAILAGDSRMVRSVREIAFLDIVGDPFGQFRACGGKPDEQEPEQEAGRHEWIS